MKLAEFNLDAMDGADKAWDAIHEWLDRYGIEISATDECDLHPSQRDPPHAQEHRG